MAFIPQNFVCGRGPAVSADWLNGVDITVNFVLNGAQTVLEAQEALGITPGGVPSFPLSIENGGTFDSTGLSLIYLGTDSGAANAYVVEAANLLTPLAAGTILRFTPLNPNTTASTIDVNGGGAVALVTSTGGALAAGELPAAPTIVEYTGTEWRILTPGLTQPALGAVLYPITAAEIAAGVTPTNYYINSDFLDPRRYGAVGDNATDDTAALNRWIAVVNATTNPVSTWVVGLTYLCGPLNNITAANFTWNCWSTLKSVPNSLTGTANWLYVASSIFKVYGLSMDGNQFAYATAAGNAELYLQQTADLLMEGCSFTNGTVKGVLFYQVSGGRISNCHFDSNANLGIETNAASYCKFVNCTFNYDGYGFQKTLATNTFAAFGVALRYQTHHFTFTNCEAKQNGRDGFCTNQGSYAIKYIGCLAWMNGDGGFTLAADNTGTGLPGEAQSCYDCEYIDCESYNNWSSGLSSYAPSINITVLGGRYYNNCRSAGMLSAPPATSTTAGVYFASGSIGINVQTKAYDDRQEGTIAVWSSPTGDIPTWVAGTAQNYPRVAFYNSTGVFQGYGTIVNEAGAPNVSFATTAFNGVNLAAVGANYRVSQRVQQVGVLFDNNVQGQIVNDGFGHLPGPNVLTGLKSVSGPLASGQNVTVPQYQLDETELLVNPTWDSSVVTGWTYNVPGGGSATLYTTAGVNLRSPGCLVLVGGLAAAQGQATLITSGAAYLQNCFCEFSVWVSAVNPGDAAVQLFWSVGASNFASSTIHPGGGYKRLVVGAWLPANATSIIPGVTSAIGKTAYFDTAWFRTRSDPYDSRDYTYPTRNLPV